MYLGFFSKSKSSAIDLDTRRSPLLLSRFKNCGAIGSPVSKFHSHDLQSVAGCSNLDWRKKEVLAEHPCAQWEVEILLGLNQCWGLKGTKHQLILHTGGKCWGTSYFLFSYVAGQTWQQEMLSSLQLAAILISEIISFYNGLYQKRNKSENIKRHQGQ